VDHYEEWGGSVLRLLAQEERVPAFRSVTDAGWVQHYEWMERVFPLSSRNARAKHVGDFWPNWLPSAMCTSGSFYAVT
jgi:hypothetical protein